MKTFTLITIMCLFLSFPAAAKAQTENYYSQEKISTILDDYKKNYPGPIVFSFTPDVINANPVESNADQTLRYPNQDDPSIQQTHAQMMNTPLRDYATTVNNAPNQNQKSNEELLRNRLNRINQ